MGRLISTAVLSQAELDEIYFDGYGLGARQVGNEIIPDLVAGSDGAPVGHVCVVLVPEASTWISGFSLLSFACWHGWRRKVGRPLRCAGAKLQA